LAIYERNNQIARVADTLGGDPFTVYTRV